MQNDISRHWALLTPFVPGDMLTAQARQVEAAGMAGIQAFQMWAAPWPTLAHCAAVTERVQLASGLANVLTRSPFETALTAIDIDRLSGGRFVLGLGPSTRAWTEGFYGSQYDDPLGRLREAVEIIRLVVAKGHTGELTSFKGRYHEHDWSELLATLAPPLRPEIPIWLGVTRRNNIRLAGEIADGVIGHPMWTADYILHKVTPVLEESLAKAGKARSDFHWNAWFWTAINNDRAEAINDAKATTAFYASMKQHEPFFAAHGYEKEARACQKAMLSKDVVGFVGAITDEMAQTFVMAGTADEVRRRVEQVWDMCDSFTLVPPMIGLEPEKMLFYIGTVAETFYS
jgi:alkanesulfonate monooxygenase SsuD/methylene tetrahydromethanopterin reductase-like flavin-dependent oxidoreductase (luciferase family)